MCSMQLFSFAVHRTDALFMRKQEFSFFFLSHSFFLKIHFRRNLTDTKIWINIMYTFFLILLLYFRLSYSSAVCLTFNFFSQFILQSLSVIFVFSSISISPLLYTKIYVHHFYSPLPIVPLLCYFFLIFFFWVFLFRNTQLSLWNFTTWTKR